MSDATKMYGIDVSHWQGTIDFKKVEKVCDFVIIKAGGSDAGFYTDKKFERNYEKAKEAGLSVGAYYFVGKNCTNYGAGVADAKRFLDIVKGKSFEFPLYIDIETTPAWKKQGATDAVIGFCDTIEKAGGYAGIYGSDIAGFKDRLSIDRLRAYDKWVARYGSKPKYVEKYGMWQKSSTGRITGIKGNVDLDEAYLNYPAIMTRAGLNHF